MPCILFEQKDGPQSAASVVWGWKGICVYEADVWVCTVLFFDGYAGDADDSQSFHRFFSGYHLHACRILYFLL